MARRSLTVLMMVILAVSVLTGSESPAQEKKSELQSKEIRNVVYKKVGKQELKLSIILPVKDGKTADKLPTLLFIESGCWNSGNPGRGGLWYKFKGIQRGFACVSISHRSLNNGTIFPDQIIDVKAAVRFLRAHSKEYHLDPERFAVMGISSGGHLSLMLGIPNRFRQFDLGDNLDQSSQVQRVICFYSITDFYLHLPNTIHLSKSCVMEVCGAKKDPKTELWSLTPEVMDRAKLCSPINYVDKDYAPTLILHGVKDSIPVYQSCLMYYRLKNAGVRTDLFIANNGIHKYETIAPDDVLEKMFFDFLQWDSKK